MYSKWSHGRLKKPSRSCSSCFRALNSSVTHQKQYYSNNVKRNIIKQRQHRSYECFFIIIIFNSLSSNFVPKTTIFVQLFCSNSERTVKITRDKIYEYAQKDQNVMQIESFGSPQRKIKQKTTSSKYYKTTSLCVLSFWPINLFGKAAFNTSGT